MKSEVELFKFLGSIVEERIKRFRKVDELEQIYYVRLEDVLEDWVLQDGLEELYLLKFLEIYW